MGWRKGKLHFCCCFIKTKDLSTLTCCNLLHCEKIANIRSFPGPYFPAFGLNKETYSVSLRIQSLCGKIRTRKTPNMDNSHVVLLSSIFRLFPRRGPSLLKYWHKQTTLKILWLTDVFFNTGYSCVFAIYITPWFALLHTTEFAFSETFLHFTFPQIFNSWRFWWGSNSELIHS